MGVWWWCQWWVAVVDVLYLYSDEYGEGEAGVIEEIRRREEVARKLELTSVPNPIIPSQVSNSVF